MHPVLTLRDTPDSTGSLPGRRRPAARAARVVAPGLALVLALAGPAAAAAPEVLGTFDKWQAFAVVDGGKKHCFVHSEPTSQRGNYKRRGKVSVTIAHRPKDGVRNEVSINAGYTFKEDSEVEVVIDERESFKLFVDGGLAWAPDAATDKRLREAIQKGSKMVVRGRSSRGTLTTDTYSLSGTGDALSAIDRACRS